MIVGIDIGGSHITGGLVTENNINLVPDSLRRYPVDSHGSADEILDAWANTIQEIWKNYKPATTKIGIAMPGPFDYEQGVSLMIGTDKYESLYQMNVRQPLAARLGIEPDQIKFRNDAEAFLLGEMMAGAGTGYARGIGITLGTGLGSSVFKNGITKDAARWQAPMLGTIAEDYISTRYLVSHYQQLTGVTIKDARELAGLAANDEIAAAAFGNFGENLAIFLKEFIKDEQPEVIVIGGNIANAWKLFYPALELGLEEELKNMTIKRASLGEEAALIGGACSWLNQELSST